MSETVRIAINDGHTEYVCEDLRVGIVLLLIKSLIDYEISPCHLLRNL